LVCSSIDGALEHPVSARIRVSEAIDSDFIPKAYAQDGHKESTRYKFITLEKHSSTFPLINIARVGGSGVVL
jgi:hypothetical protein